MAPSQLILNGRTQIADQSIPSSKISPDFALPTNNLADAANIAFLTGMTMRGPIDMGGNPIINSTAPTSALSLVTRAYVDALVSGFTLHGMLAVADSNFVLSGLQTVDGVFGAVGNLILAIAQTDPTQNGPWVQQNGAWTRPAWWATGSTVQEGNYFILDSEGGNYPNTKWFVASGGAITVGTSPVTFRQDLAGLRYTAGGGLSLNGVVFSVNTGSGISILNNAVSAVADPAYLGQVSPNGIGVAPGATGQFIQTMNGKPIWQTMGGDATFTAGGALIVRSTGGTMFAPSATTDTTNASNIQTGYLAGSLLRGNYTQITGVGTITTGTWNGSVVTVGYGGTGAGTLPAGGVLVGNDASPVTSLVGTNGQLLFAVTGAPPAWQTVSGDVSFTSGGYAKVDHTPGTGFIRYTDIITDETPGGNVDGNNVNFTLANIPQAQLELLANGVELEIGGDFTINGLNITMNYALNANTKFRANYIK